jgi:hypothetical protein
MDVGASGSLGRRSWSPSLFPSNKCAHSFWSVGNTLGSAVGASGVDRTQVGGLLDRLTGLDTTAVGMARQSEAFMEDEDSNMDELEEYPEKMGIIGGELKEIDDWTFGQHTNRLSWVVMAEVDDQSVCCGFISVEAKS